MAMVGQTIVAYRRTHHSIANRHSYSTLAETQDRKCFSVELNLMVGKVDMINQICQMLSFC